MFQINFKGYYIVQLLGKTFIIGREALAMEQYECTVCGYIYDPELGDPEGGVEPGTSFEDVPEDWVCPECGVGKDMFEVVT